MVEGHRLAAAVLDRAEALERLVERRDGPLDVARRARGPRLVVERVADGLGAGEAMEGEDRLLEVQPRAALRPVVEQAQAEGHDLEERRVVVGDSLEERQGLVDERTGLLVIGAVPRGHRGGVDGRRLQSLVAEAAREGDRVGEELVRAGGVAHRLLEHRVLVEGRGRRVLVAQLAVVVDGLLDAVQVHGGVAAAQREARRWPAAPRRAARCARARRRASPPASGRPRRSSRGPARSATARWPGAARPAGRAAARR